MFLLSFLFSQRQPATYTPKSKQIKMNELVDENPHAFLKLFLFDTQENNQASQYFFQEINHLWPYIRALVVHFEFCICVTKFF